MVLMYHLGQGHLKVIVILRSRSFLDQVVMCLYFYPKAGGWLSSKSLLMQYFGHSKGIRYPNRQNSSFYHSGLDLDPMTLVIKPDLDMVKMDQHTKNKVSMSRHSEVIAETDTDCVKDRHTDRTKTLPSRTRGRKNNGHVIH